MKECPALLPEQHKLPQPFLLLDSVSEFTPNRLIGEKLFTSAPPWQALEAAAQLCSLHLRLLTRFSCRTFLLSVEKFALPAGHMPDGLFSLAASLLHRNRQAAEYAASLSMQSLHENGCAQNILSLSGIIRIGACDYSDKKQEALLKKHYQYLCERLCATTCMNI